MREMRHEEEATLLSWCSPDTDLGARPLLATLRVLGGELTLIPCTGLLDKIASLRKALAQISDDRVICAVDGYDTIFLQTSATIREQYRRFGEKVVFSAQRTNEHHFPQLQAHLSSDDVAHWPNTGVIVGRCAEMRWMLEEINGWNLQSLEGEFNLTQNKTGRFNDQTVFGRFVALYPELVAVDADCHLSRTSAYDRIGEADSELTREMWKNPDGSMPCVFHLPFTCKGVYARYLQMVESRAGALAPAQVDLARLSALCPGEDGYGVLARGLMGSYRSGKNFRLVFLFQLLSKRLILLCSKIRRQLAKL